MSASVGCALARKLRDASSPSNTASSWCARSITSSALRYAPNTVNSRAAAGPKAIWPAATENQAFFS